jgi:hypothetical protein
VVVNAPQSGDVPIVGMAPVALQDRGHTSQQEGPDDVYARPLASFNRQLKVAIWGGVRLIPQHSDPRICHHRSGRYWYEPSGNLPWNCSTVHPNSLGRPLAFTA